ncbi:MAG TPA: sugar phosphate nucleotidyltransferase, partial [Gaiellaceae bacterium]|nr:sugar phosphate nucleotidyltransferase [Gaiellaceae bacterium]
MDAVVMAAGEGRRLRPITDRWPKPVLPIDGRPVLATLLRELARAELGPVWLVVGHLADQVEALAGDGSAFGVEIRAVQQPEPLGS